MSFFTSTIAHVNFEGKKVKEQYLYQCESYTEAETKTIETRSPYTSDFEIASLTKPRIAEIIRNEKAEKWHKLTAQFITLDEKKGVEKKVSYAYLIQSDSCEAAIEAYHEYMKGSVMDYEITAVSLTPILEYYPESES